MEVSPERVPTQSKVDIVPRRKPKTKSGPGEEPRLVEFVDIFPTLCDLAGIELSKKVNTQLQGTSFKPLLMKPD